MLNFSLHVITLISIFSILAYALNLVTGFGGLLVFCQASFYGVGAYSYALLRIGNSASPLTDTLLAHASCSFPVAVACAASLGALSALAAGVIALRFRGDVFVLATLGFQLIIYDTLRYATPLTRGTFGIYSIARPELLGWQVREPVDYALLFAALAGSLAIGLGRLGRSRFALRLKALRDNERAAESLGISAFRQHLGALAVFGALSATAGALLASYVTYIDPSSFQLSTGLFVLSCVLLGGTGNVLGPLLGVIVMVVLPELLRFVGMPESIAANAREIVYGVALILLMQRRPQGLAGAFRVA